MASPYNERVIQQLIIDGLAPLGRGGQTRLAEAVGVRVQTVNKWVKRQTCPEPDKWPAIEEFLGLDEGTILRKAWPAATDPAQTVVGIEAFSGIEVLRTLSAEELEEVIRVALERRRQGD